MNKKMKLADVVGLYSQKSPLFKPEDGWMWNGNFLKDIEGTFLYWNDGICEIVVTYSLTHAMLLIKIRDLKGKNFIKHEFSIYTNTVQDVIRNICNEVSHFRFVNQEKSND